MDPNSNQNSPVPRSPSCAGGLFQTNGSAAAAAAAAGLTHGEVAELHEGFRLLAGNNVVQSIGIRELKDTFVSVGFPPLDDEQLQELLRVVNQQLQSDHLTFPEFLLLMTKQVDSTMLEELRSAFRVYDKQGTGFVTTAQLCEMLATMGEKSSPEEVNEFIGFADAEGTGRVDYTKMLREIANKLKR